MAAENRPPEDLLLEKIVHGYINILKQYGLTTKQHRFYEGRNFNVRDGAVSFPVLDEDNGMFFGYIANRWFGDKFSYKLHFYEADKIPLAARLELIEYSMRFHEEHARNSTLAIRMMKGRYKKLGILPDAFLEMKLDRIER